MTPEDPGETAVSFIDWVYSNPGKAATDYASELAKIMADARSAAFEEAAKIAERHLPAGMYPEALAGAIAAAIRQHAKGDGK